MSYPYDRRMRGASRRQVPMHVAQELADQRDRLMAEVQRLRRANDQLAEGKRAAEASLETLERRAEEAERAAAQLRGKLEELAVEQAEAAQKAAEDEREAEDEARREEAEVVARLSKRIEELTGDLERVRRHTTTKVEAARRDERARLLSGLGDVLDSIDRAIEMDTEGAWRQGLEAIRSQLVKFMRAEGARVTGEPGEKMNPRVHQAMGMVDSDQVDSGHVVRVARHGLELEDGTVVRPAQVVVAR